MKQLTISTLFLLMSYIGNSQNLEFVKKHTGWITYTDSVGKKIVQEFNAYYVESIAYIPEQRIKDSTRFESGQYLIKYVNTKRTGQFITLLGSLTSITGLYTTYYNYKDSKSVIISGLVICAIGQIIQYIAPNYIIKSGTLLSFGNKKKTDVVKFGVLPN